MESANNANEEQAKQKEQEASQAAAVQAQQLKELQQQLEQLRQQNQQLMEKKEEREEKESAVEVERSIKEMLGVSSASEKASKKGLEDLSNEELIAAMSEAVETLVDSKAKQATKNVEAIIQGNKKQIEAIQGVVMNLAVQSDIRACKDKFTDFDKYKKEIGEELKQTPGLSIEKAYLLVKASKMASSPGQRSIETEKGDDALTESLERQNEEEQEEEIVDRSRANRNKADFASAKNNVTSFRELLDKAADKVISARLRREGKQ